jgi:hypothetical protein
MFTESILKKKQEQGLIRGYTKTTLKKGNKKIFQNVGKEKLWMEATLREWCAERGAGLVPEFQFSTRKFRFDWAAPSLKISWEYEGIFSKQSRHTNKQGYSKDVEKYNLGTAAGWRIFRYTATNYRNLSSDLKSL